MSSTTSSFEACGLEFDFDQNPKDFIQCVSLAQEEVLTAQIESLAEGVDTFYLIFAGALVYFMQTGFAMLCAGSIRAKNVKNVILWNLLDSCGGGLAFWICGYAFAYGGDDSNDPKKSFVGSTNFFLMNPDTDYESWFFQFAFACALSSIVAGTIAERTKMTAYLLYSAFLVGFVYPVIAHSFWSPQGFLSNTAVNPLWDCGAYDLAGSGPVHMTGGVCALAAAIVLGPRIGRFYDEDGNLLDEPHDFPPHSVALQFLGTFCLWFGWYGFNPGSTLAIASAQSGGVASLVAVNTTLSACAGAVAAMFLSTLWDLRTVGIAQWDLGYTMNGCLTGLVAITAGCASVETWAAVVIGIFAGLFYLLGSRLLVRLRIDDAVDAIPVHMVGGAWGVISTGLFSKPSLMEAAYGKSTHSGWFYEWGQGSGDFTMIGIQLLAVLWIFSWTFIVMGIYFYILNMFGLLRISALEEEVGMDISRHKGSAYDMEGSAPKDKVDELNISRSRHSLKEVAKKAHSDDDKNDSFEKEEVDVA